MTNSRAQWTKSPHQEGVHPQHSAPFFVPVMSDQLSESAVMIIV